MPTFSAAEILTLIAALAAAIVSVITAWRTSGVKQVVADTSENMKQAVIDTTVSVAKEQKTQLTEIKFLVDGRYGNVLAELALVRAMLADKTGEAIDVARAVQAQSDSDHQAARVIAAKEVAEASKT